MNAVAIHPLLLHIVTSGIERHITLHSLTPSSPIAQDHSLTLSGMRQLRKYNADDEMQFLRALLGPHPTLIDQADDERQIINLFDQLVHIYISSKAECWASYSQRSLYCSWKEYKNFATLCLEGLYKTMLMVLRMAQCSAHVFE